MILSSELDAQKRPETEELWVHTSEGQPVAKDADGLVETDTPTLMLFHPLVVEQKHCS